MDAALAEQRLKNMVSWETSPALSEDDVSMLLKAARVLDTAGYDWTSQNWTPTYRLNWAASEAWRWKAGAATDRYKVMDDHTELNRQQVFEHCMKMADLYKKLSNDQVFSVRSRGDLVENRLGAYSTVPWWWELAGN